MIERNLRNFIEWREPDGTTLDLVPRIDEIDEEEVESIFETELSSELVEENEILSRNV